MVEGTVRMMEGVVWWGVDGEGDGVVGCGWWRERCGGAWMAEGWCGGEIR